jgi:hypothetical protein
MLFWQLFSSYMYVEKAAETTFIQKICMKNVDEIDGSFEGRGPQSVYVNYFCPLNSNLNSIGRRKSQNPFPNNFMKISFFEYNMIK